MMSIVRRSMDLDLIGTPVAHEVVHFLDGVFDVFAVDPINHVDAFAGAARIHTNATNIAAAAKKSCCIGIGRCRYTAVAANAPNRARRVKPEALLLVIFVSSRTVPACTRCYARRLNFFPSQMRVL